MTVRARGVAVAVTLGGIALGAVLAPAASAALAPANCCAMAGSPCRNIAWYIGMAMFQDRMPPESTTSPMFMPTM